MLIYISGSTSAATRGEIISSSGDVTTAGASGIAYFNLSSSFTDLETNIYPYEIYWITGSDEYVLDIGSVNVLDRIKV